MIHIAVFILAQNNNEKWNKRARNIITNPKTGHLRRYLVSEQVRECVLCECALSLPIFLFFKERLISSQVRDSSAGRFEEQEVKAGRTARLSRRD